MGLSGGIFAGGVPKLVGLFLSMYLGVRCFSHIQRIPQRKTGLKGSSTMLNASGGDGGGGGGGPPPRYYGE